jgi:atrazine chlorohydrolase/5-methylthioadenosine/S-adenosylhomocysteine deaminase/melamine deaminase
VTSLSLLIRNGLVVTVDPGRRVIENGYVAIAEDRILAVGAMADCPPAGSAQVIDASGHAVLPGFVNAHVHTFDILLRGGLAEDRGLYDWLCNIVLPGTQAQSDAEIRTAAQLFCLEAVRSGATTLVDNVEAKFDRWDRYAETITSVYAECGLRGVYSQMFYDYTPPDIETLFKAIEARSPDIDHDLGVYALAGALEKTETIMRRHHGAAEGRISVWPSPGVAVLCSREGLLGAKALAKKYGVRVGLHLGESPADRMQHGMTSIEYLNAIGFLGPDILAAHCVQLSDKDIRILGASGANVVTNPVSNLYLGNGVARVAEMIQAGVKVGLGTDDAIANGGANILADMKTLALVQKGHYRDAAVITAEKVIEMVTIDGAEAIGLGHEIGSLEAGKKADVTILDLRAAHLVPRHSVASVIVYQCRGDEVDTVIVDGRVILRHRRPAWLSPEGEQELMGRAQRASERVAAAARLPRHDDSTWVARRA